MILGEEIYQIEGYPELVIPQVEVISAINGNFYDLKRINTVPLVNSAELKILNRICPYFWNV